MLQPPYETPLFTLQCRAVAKSSSCGVYAFSRQRNKKLGVSLGSFSFSVLRKLPGIKLTVARGSPSTWSLVAALK